MKAGDTALVGGSGRIGLLTAAVLKGMGGATIISELSQDRKEEATSSGVADHVLDPSKEDVPARVRELTGGTGADVAFECAGVNAVLDTTLDAVRPGAVVVNASICNSTDSKSPGGRAGEGGDGEHEFPGRFRPMGRGVANL